MNFSDIRSGCCSDLFYHGAFITDQYGFLCFPVNDDIGLPILPVLFSPGIP
jgi:hypothetical protein